MGIDLAARIRNVTAVLGPTNTGKTHLAIERMIGHDTGMIGLPLRLLAREVYDKISARIGADKVALVTGEEKIKPENPRFWVSTVEAMPREIDVDFLAIDEIQLAADLERGHVFTDRLLHARGKLETLLLGAGTMRDAISDLIPGANFISRPRLSKLTYAGQKKITRLPARSAIVAFSASEVYAIAELIRRQRGGAAVVLGALSPRTRNAQVALYQSGDVDFLVATDAIGMGLNLDVGHVAFAATRKFDGHNHRNLTPAELAQIAGRAGRHMNDGTFGVTGDVEPFDPDIIDRIETHTFDSVKVLQWRNRALDTSSLDALRDSLREMPREGRLTRARMADDVLALETVSHDRDVLALAKSPAAVAMLWDVCQVPDYRKISTQAHAELIATLYKFLLTGEERIPEDWFEKQVAFADRTDGDIDTLANRIAHVRTWTFVSNRTNWLKDHEHWQGRTRAIEDSLSDALHERLTQRFVDQRTSALMKGMRDKDELQAEIGEDGSVQVENHFVGRLIGFRFQPTEQGEGIHGKATRNAAAQVLAKEFVMRARRVASAKGDALKLNRRGRVLWRDEEIARIEPGEDPLRPQVLLLADENLQASDRERVQERLNTWIAELVQERLKPLVELSKAEEVTGLARGIAFRLAENLGALRREDVAEEIKSLDQTGRAQLRKYGVRFGAFNIFFPLLLKPAAAELALTLWALTNAPKHGLSLDALPDPPRPGLTSVSADQALPDAFYRANGFHRCGPRAVRIDILERLADSIRPLLAWRKNAANPTPQPKGATGDGGFKAIPEMMSTLGCSPEELAHVLRALGFRLERRPLKPAAPENAPPVGDPSGIGEVQTEEVAGVPTVEGEAIEPAIAAEAEAAAEGGEPASMPAEAPPASLAEQAGPAVPAEGAQPAADAVVAATESEEKFEEIWRPRRRKTTREHGEARPGRRHHKPAGRQPQVHGTVAAGQAAQPAAPQAAGGAQNRAERPEGERRPGQERNADRHRDRDRDRNRDHRRRDGRPGDDRRRRDDRPPLQTRSAPTTKKGEVDPDSPFAALGALKQALEKRAQDPNSS
jgi:ATP-dependent RNA helicase SUPV3L1/SUV3